MKLHLPSALRKALLLSLGMLTAAATSAQAEIMHNSATLLTYTDFASNMGRYSIYQQNELLKHLKEEGVYISFTQGEDPYLLENGVISFESAVDGGPFTAIGYNVTATVQHNGVTNPVFTGRFIGSDQSVHYAGIEYRSCKNNNFLLTPKTDYKITRLSKVITDITPSTLFDTEAYVKDGGQVKGMLQYHMGGGYQQRADENGKTTWLREAYVYVTAGIVEITGFSRETEYDVTTGVGPQDVRGIYDDSYTIGMTGVMGGDQWGPGTAGTPSHPLPYVTQGGDSGSPVWVWNASSGQYELISCHQARGGNNSYSRGASEWTKDTLEHFNNHVDMSKEGCTHEVHITAVNQQDTEIISDIANGSQPVSTQPWRGEVVLSNGEKIDFIGVHSGVNTWNNLVALKDGQIPDDKGEMKNVNWYAYGNEYLNSTYNEGGDLEYAELFMTENLNFQSSAAENTIILDADVDLGIGYAQFSAKDGSKNVSYTIKDEQNNTRQFNHAGYIIDEGVSVHIKLVNNQKDASGTDYFREWRKVGEGDLYLEGSGDNHIFLNVGGKGSTFLKEQNGYAAYNVLINNGATVNLGENVEQVKRDVTFGYGGGTLDFAGNVNMEWNNSNDAEDPGFTIHALTQDAIIANTTGTTTLTYTEGGNTNFQGSFQDGDGKGTLKVVYDVANGTWTLNSIHTELHDESGLEVKNGRVVLAGTLTEHAQGSLNGYNQQRYSNADDWHYADAAMNVTVDDGAIFELGSHARLTGDVTVQSCGTFLMREGVRHEMEYIEGWYKLERTYDIADYYGLHGNVNLESGSQMQVQFSEKTDANTTLKGSISGSGSMTVNTGKGSLTLAGDNSGFGGSKQLDGGVLILQNIKAAGNISTNKWKLSESSWMTVENTDAATALNAVDKTSKGVLALSQDEDGTPINLDTVGYGNLIIGAREGEVIQFGKETGETRAYAAVGGKWNLGGGGGNLVVNYKLDDDNGTLVLGNEYTTGSVTLTNTDNNIHAIDFAGKVTLAYTDSKALGGADINLNYTNRIMGADGTLGLINPDADGVMLLDNIANQDINLSGHAMLNLGAAGEVTYTGEITLDPDADAYYFGGITGTLKIDSVLGEQNDGWTSLVLDGQTYSGGVLELTHALEISGMVDVYGHSPYIDGLSGGDATLRLCENNSLAEQFVSLYDGGIIDINGTVQEFSSINADTGSRIIDTKGTGELRIISEGTEFSFLTLAGEVDVNTISIHSSGTVEGTPLSVSLAGKMSYENMTVDGDSGIAVVADDVLCSTGKTLLDTTSLSLGQYNATTMLELNDSRIELGDSKAKRAGELSGAISTLDDTQNNVIHFILNDSGNASKISSVVDVAKNSKLTITGDKARFGSASFAESGGSLVMAVSHVNLENSTGTHFGGTLDILGKNGGMTLYGSGGSDNILREIDKLKVQADTTLTLQEGSRNTIWNIHELTGAGDVTWNSQSTHWYSSRVLLGALVNSEEGGTFKPDADMGTYSGVFTARRNISNTDETRAYASYVELAHDTIMQGAKVDLQGCEQGYMTLAVNTDNGKIKGLEGNNYTALYAGVAVEGGDQQDSQLTKTPVSTREANLIITGDGAYAFKGNVYGGDDGTHDGLNIVMNGTGKQTFSGAEVTVNSVTAKQGELVLSAASLAIKDRATIYRGATLGTGDKEFTLGHNMTLMVAGSGEDLAKLTSTLKLDGGSIGFDGTTINTSGYALSVQGVNGQKELDIIFESTASLQQDTEYKLASGSEWVGITYHSNNLEYYDAAFNAQNEGLTVTFSLKKDNNIWLGSNDKTTWDDNNFGISKDVPGEGKTAVFNDLAESQDVQVHGERKSEKLLFDSTKEYTLEGKEAGASLAANSLLQTGSGTTKLGSGVRINGAVDVQAGTLVLQDGSHANSAAVAKGATLQLESAAAFEGTVAGEGDVKVAWQGEQQGTLGTAETGIGSLTVESGKLNAAGTLNVQRSASVLAGATLQSSTGNILAQEGQPLQLAGTLVIDAGSSNMELKTDVTGLNETLGTVEKTGANTLTVKSSLVADTLAVKQGRVEIKDSGILMEFLDKTQNLEAVNGGYALLGGNAFTLESDEYTTNLLVGGSKSTIELALGQHSTKTFQGELSMTDGGTLKLYDGGVQINGKITLGVGGSDRVTLWGNWGEANSASKAGIILAGEVSGSGTVVLDKGGNAKNQCVTLINDGNTFDGTYEVNDKTSLVVGADSAIRDASVNMKGGSLVIRADASTKSLVSDSGKGLIQIEEGKSLGLQNTNYSGQIKFAEDVTVTANVSGTVAQLTGDVTLESTEAGKAAITGAENTSLANACINLSAGTSLKINKVTMAGQAAITGANGSRIDTSLIDLAAGTRLEMANVTLSSDSSVTDGATLVANNLVVEALQPLTFGDSQTKQVEEPAVIASLTLSNIKDVIIEGAEDKGMLVHLVGDYTLGNVDWVKVGLGEGAKFNDGLAVTLLYENEAGQELTVHGQYTMAEVEEQAAIAAAAQNHDYVYFRITGTVPEPATGTLSLLALAALAARRRRK